MIVLMVAADGAIFFDPLLRLLHVRVNQQTRDLHLLPPPVALRGALRLPDCVPRALGVELRGPVSFDAKLVMVLKPPAETKDIPTTSPGLDLVDEGPRRLRSLIRQVHDDVDISVQPLVVDDTLH